MWHKRPFAVDDQAQVLHPASHRDFLSVDDEHRQFRRRGSSATLIEEPQGLELGRRHARAEPLNGVYRARHGGLGQAHGIVPPSSAGQHQRIVRVAYHASTRWHGTSEDRVAGRDQQDRSQHRTLRHAALHRPPLLFAVPAGVSGPPVAQVHPDDPDEVRRHLKVLQRFHYPDPGYGVERVPEM